MKHLILFAIPIALLLASCESLSDNLRMAGRLATAASEIINTPEK